MTTTNVNATIWQGETHNFIVPLLNESGTAYGSTSGLTFTVKVTSSKTSTTALLTKTTGSGITNGTSQITIAFAESDTDDLASGDYWWECRVVDGTSQHDVVFVGGFIVEPSTTVTV